MTAADFILVRPLGLTEPELYLLLADCVYEARLRDGSRVLDAGDFREWLLELASAAKVESEVLK